MNRRAAPAAEPPMIGSLLRLPYSALRDRLYEAGRSAGYDVTTTELGVFLYPRAHGRRPYDLARQCGTTRQGMNYLLSGLESRGYLERRGVDGSSAILVWLTPRGQKLHQCLRKEVARIEKEWTAVLGKERFTALKQALLDLSRALGELE
jgi:DNA-binding MarR family transcriptional regulator